MYHPSLLLPRRVFMVAIGTTLGLGAANIVGGHSLPSALAAAGDSKLGTVRIGYQKSGTVQISLKKKQILEKLFGARGGSVEWLEFTAGLPMVEALNAGAIDIGYVGEAPPIFAQAANGSSSRYVAYDPYGPGAEGILVDRNSPIRSIADLKGKKIGVQKGSNTHYLTIKALQSVKLKPSDVTITFLKPADGRAAFERRDIDAWVVWDPFLAAGEINAKARLLSNAKGLAPNLGYYLSREAFIRNQPAALRLVLTELRKEAAVVSRDPRATAAFLAPQLGLAEEVLLRAETRRKHGVLPITSAVIDKQQDVADTFRELQLIPKPIKVKEAVWRWN